MALPTFVKSATSLDAGVSNSIASQLSKVRDAKRLINEKTSSIDGILETLDNNNLPDVPSVSDLEDIAGDFDSQLSTKLAVLDDIDDITGGCFGGAIGSIKSLSDNGLGMVDDILSGFSDLAGMPSQMFDISGIYSQIGSFLGSLGLDGLISDINSSLGCLSDSSMISSVQSEISSLTSELGLDSSGKLDDETFYSNMKSDLASKASDAGIDTSFTDSMSDGLAVMTKKSNEMSDAVKSAASSKISALKQTAKDSIPKTPTPPSFF